MKLKRNNEGFSSVSVLVVLVTLALVGGIGWYVWHRNQNTKPITLSSEQPNKNTPASKAQTSTKPKVTIPSSFSTYSNSSIGFSLAYPASWGKLEAPTTNDLSSFIAVTPSLSNFALDQSVLNGRLSLTASPTTNFTITTAKYGATVKPHKQGSIVTWTVTDVNPADTTDKVGDIYHPKPQPTSNGLAVYDFEFADESTWAARYVFATKNDFIEVDLPELSKLPAADGTPAAPQSTEILDYYTIASAIANTIQLQ